jgi:hypothetical protein
MWEGGVEKKEKRHFYLIKKIKIMKWGRKENKKLKMEVWKANGVGYGGGTGRGGGVIWNVGWRTNNFHNPPISIRAS